MLVRTGAFRGRSLMWCSFLSPVAHCSKNGHSPIPVKMMPSGNNAGMNTDSDSVCPRKLYSHAGIMRSEPSRKPMYQSGCDADEIASGVYGPYSHTGLIWQNVASRTSPPKMKKNQACPLSRKYGQNGCPITFFSVTPLPGIWVCFWWNMTNRCAATSARMRPGTRNTCRMYSRGMIAVPGNGPSNRKYAAYVPTIGTPWSTPSRIRRPAPDSWSSGSE
jgi:hypothetical protein